MFAGAALRRTSPAEQADPLGRLFVSVAGIFVAYDRGRFALECWRLGELCREMRYVAGATQPGSVADLIFHGCRLSGVNKLLEKARKRTCTRDGETQLCQVAEYNKIQLVRRLFSLGCPDSVINAQDFEGCTALTKASYEGHEAIVRVLLAHGANANIKDEDGWTPLMNASSEGHLAVVRLLCDAPGIDLTVRGGSRKLTALGWARRDMQAKVVAFLRSRGAPRVRRR